MSVQPASQSTESLSASVTFASSSHSIQLDERPTQDITVGRFSLQGGTSFLMAFEDVIADTNLPPSSAEGTWKKAAMLIAEANSVVPAPGFGPSDKMVKSKSGSTPHLITVTKSDNGVQYKCDKCPQDKSVYICSSTLLLLQNLMEI